MTLSPTRHVLRVAVRPNGASTYRLVAVKAGKDGDGGARLVKFLLDIGSRNAGISSFLVDSAKEILQPRLCASIRQALLAGLDSASPGARPLAASLLGELGIREAAPRLTALRASDSSEEVRAAAVRALQRFAK